MTSLKSIVISLALIVNDINVIISGSIHEHPYLGAVLVYLISVAILVGQLKLFPSSFWRSYPILCLCIEIPFVIIVLEFSIAFIWFYIQNYITYNAESILSHLAEERGLEGIVCYMCCGKNNCSHIFTKLILRMFSFSLLTAVFTFVNVK